MTGMQGSFDASQFKPQQGFDIVPPGRHPFQISNTEITPTKDQTGGMFVVTFQTPNGQIQSRYNLWNQSAKAVEIAHGQLSALCHAVGIFRLDWQNEGAALRGAQGMIDVGFQKGQEPTAENPQGGYVEVKKVLDRNGNEPGKQGAAPIAPQPQPSTPMQQQPSGAWGNAPTPNAAPAQSPVGPPPNPNTGWNGPQQPASGPAQAGWSQQPGGQASSPPWAK